MDCIVRGVAMSWTQLRDFHFEVIFLVIFYIVEGILLIKKQTAQE